METGPAGQINPKMASKLHFSADIGHLNESKGITT